MNEYVQKPRVYDPGARVYVPRQDGYDPRDGADISWEFGFMIEMNWGFRVCDPFLRHYDPEPICYISHQQLSAQPKASSFLHKNNLLCLNRKQADYGGFPNSFSNFSLLLCFA
ncbi:hypothetical protein [Siminovitchia fortis]|uniref:hypothetical protein n=1 Tax=Siminovitchia fortis TaxID=254758 RepID=UPI000E745D9B|nr:hypothetical protein [Siminovitchia fortis]